MTLKNVCAWMGVLSGVVVFSGCVTTGTYKKALADNETIKAERDQLSAKADELGKTLEKSQEEKDALIRQNQATKSNYDSLVNQLAQEVADGQLKVTQYKNMLTVDLAEQIFFDSGSAELKASGKTVLKKLADALIQYKDKVIRVVGHTDNVPVGKTARKLFPTNWELSVGRATNVVRYLQDDGKLDPQILIASGRGEYYPIATNDTPEGRKKNRRIEIMLLDKNMAEAITKSVE